jgi:hypothetical protein
MANKTVYKFEDKNYTTWENLNKAVMESHPELLDDSLVEFIESNVEEIELEICCVCGKFISCFTPPALAKKGFCSWGCADEIYCFSRD